MTKKITVGMAEFKIIHNPCILEVLGLGSCVAICLRDEKTKIAALAHIILPDSKEAAQGINPLRFVDKTVDAMVKSMLILGCKTHDIKAKLCGGAEIFPNVPRISDIGKKNVEAVRKKLREKCIEIVAEDVGGTEGRSIWFDTETGEVVVSRIHGPTTSI
ncbi:MAG: chemotaxis protein CheD [Candidatus Altiarchaeota archaeon]|nr:chemotaxis protein CheD [Candidatus Altiarchaeota archaeon]